MQPCFQLPPPVPSPQNKEGSLEMGLLCLLTWYLPAQYALGCIYNRWQDKCKPFQVSGGSHLCFELTKVG